MTEQQLTHIDEQGDVRMVDVSQKADTCLLYTSRCV